MNKIIVTIVLLLVGSSAHSQQAEIQIPTECRYLARPFVGIVRLYRNGVTEDNVHEGVDLLHETNPSFTDNLTEQLHALIRWTYSIPTWSAAAGVELTYDMIALCKDNNVSSIERKYQLQRQGISLDDNETIL